MKRRGAAPEHEYLRAHKRFPSVWCPGCGIGVVLGAIIRAVRALGLSKDDVALLSGIGCTGRMPVYADFNTMHTTHGRALAFATGLKLARPDMEVIVVMGDGDALAIGGNHFIHAARRNMELTAIVVNNRIYGMTGGQVSPTTPTGDKALTAPYGQIEQAFDVAKIAEAAGASFVARGTTYHAMELDRLIVRGIEKRGFSMIEVLAQCPVSYGELNQAGDAVEMLKWLRDNTTPAGAGAAPGKIPRGVLVDREMPGYVESYHRLVAVSKRRARG